MEKEYKLLGVLYSVIVILLLLIQYQFKLPHPEWGLLTLPLIFSPSKSHFIQKSIYRIGATIIGAILLLSISFINSYYIYYAALVGIVLGLGHLAIKYKKYFYFFFIIIITLGIFGLGNFQSSDTSALKISVSQRLGETILGCVFVILPTLFYLSRRKNLNFPEPTPPNFIEVSHLQFFLRGFTSYLCFIIIYSFIDNKMLQGAATMLTILIGATSIHKNPMPEIIKTIKVIVASTFVVYIVKYYLQNTSTFIPVYFNIIMLGVLFGCLMYLALKIPSKAFYSRMIMVIAPVIYSLTPSNVEAPSIFIKVLSLFVLGGIISMIGHYISHHVHHISTKSKNNKKNSLIN